ncbi:MAG: ROK family protein [Oscillospiraceae bacterium]|nr:ROK family protein [Oscillospiraceae bacterium]
MKYYLGIDLGGTRIKTGIVNENLEIIGKSVCLTNCPRSAEAIVDDIVNTARIATNNASISLNQIECIGIGVPGTANRKTGIIEFANNLGFYNIPIVDMIKSKIEKPVFLDNDANCAVYGEYCAGIAQNKNTIVGITLGTGVGGGIIIDKKIFSGFNFAGGEIGHMVIVADGKKCSCGRKGCFETYASAKALLFSAKEQMLKDKLSLLWNIAGDIDNLTIHNIFTAKKQNDKTAKNILDEFFKYLGIGVVNIVNIFQPELLFFGGIMAEEGDELITPIKEILEKEVYNRLSKNKTEIAVAFLGNDAGIIGASQLYKLKF